MERNMQPQRIPDNEVSPLSDRLVGARGANAARRAAQVFDVPSVSSAKAGNDDDAGQPVARRPDTPTDTPTAQEPVAAKTFASRISRKAAMIGAAAVVALAAGGWYGTHWLTTGRFIVSTDDAYVRADATTLAAKVAGYVSAIGVADNTYVRTGDVIARIDDGDSGRAA